MVSVDYKIQEDHYKDVKNESGAAVLIECCPKLQRRQVGFAFE